MLGRVAAGRSECGRVCLPKTVQTPGAAAVWSGLPAARKEMQSKEGAEDAAAAGVGGRLGRRRLRRDCMQCPPALCRQVRTEQRLLSPPWGAGAIAASEAAAKVALRQGPLQPTKDLEGDACPPWGSDCRGLERDVEGTRSAHPQRAAMRTFSPRTVRPSQCWTTTAPAKG